MRYLLLFLITLSQLFSAPALDRMREFQNSDGTTFMAKAQGNQHLNWIQTQDGEILRYNSKSHNFEYAVIKENRLRASGVKYEKNNSKYMRSSGNRNKLKKNEVYKLWDKKRAQHYKRIKESQK